MRSLLVVAAMLGAQLPLAAQTRFSPDAVEEIQSLSVRVEVVGDPDGGRLVRLLDDAIRQQLHRADILFERPDPRGGDCCVLRLDIRLATGAGRSRFGVGYVVRLELGFEDRMGGVPAWTLIWTSRLMANVVERAELTDGVRFAAGELVGDFVDLYRERFPRR